ncbi:MAG: S1 RNA-binding domain-containing protein, partial [Ignavibacteria bacterium]|nr:S1 RNA-binding domain-containing protein [Ignavibacteria bacterium]
LTNFGVFVELEPGVDGLVHISDLSWTKKIRHPGEVVKKGEKLEVIVLSVDMDQRKISLGHKQIYDNPWDKFETIYAAGTETTGKVVRIIEKGLIVELPDQVDGFVPTTQLSTSRIKNLALHFPIESTLNLKVIEFDKESKKIVLSCVSWLKEQTEDVIEEYIQKFKLERVSTQDVKTAETVVDPADFAGIDIVDDAAPAAPAAAPEAKEEEKPQE